ncbi:hypothetical protein [Phormidium sp. CCY1219]|uniref:hypothetical protein n=1 Tax=Phormidium sp. CCY1219 TaxID=2886104 RepID=UPI002D1E4DE6|nr:hypothetical protein [Phormidium sp. CCY1219]MEB3830557.1 hypothetical protein [Phormidium sp. CCY1219]
MKLYQSRFGYAMSLIYLIGSGSFIWWEFHSYRGGMFDFCGLGLIRFIFPSLLTVGVVLEKIGVPQIKLSCSYMGLADSLQFGLHLSITAVFVYLIGYGVEWIVRRVSRRLS